MSAELRQRAEFQQEVQRKLGSCIFRMSQYEILAKALVGNRELSAPAEKMHEAKAGSVAG